MHSGRVSVCLLSAFTTHDRAESIVGDLLEESDRRRAPRYPLRTAGIALALCLQSVRQAPLRWLALALLGLAAYGCVLSLALVAGGLPWHVWNRVYEPEFWFRLAVAIAAANLTTGFVLRRWISLGGTSAIVAIVPLWLAGWPLSVVFKVLVYPGSLLAGMTAALAFPILGLMPLVAGAALAARGRRTRTPHAAG